MRPPVQMMKRNDFNADYIKNDLFDAIKLPFGDKDSDIYATFILPKEILITDKEILVKVIQLYFQKKNFLMAEEILCFQNLIL